MTNTTGFDPEHDARFQRGYDPNTEPREAASGPLGLGAGVGTPTDAPYGSRAEARAAVAPRPRAGLSSRAAASVPEPGEGAVDFVRGTIGTEQFDDESPAPRRNPFVIALWIVGPLLIVGGVALVAQGASNNGYSYSGGEMPWGMILLQVSWALGPTMISTGFATIVGLLFWHAFAWHRARAARTPTE